MCSRWRTAACAVVLLLLLSSVYLFYAGALRTPQRVVSWWRDAPQEAQLGNSPDLDSPWRSSIEGNFPSEEQGSTPIVGLRNIFFVETSCALLDIPTQASRVNLTTEFGGLRLTPRTACAVEAAARAHPQRPVYVVHTCPLDAVAMWETAPIYALRVLSMPNVRLWPVRLAQLFAGTTLESLLTDAKLGRSTWPVVHASDILRFYLVWRFGGTYLDSDVLVLRSLDDMQNFACAEEDRSLNNAVLDLARDETGMQIADECIKELRYYRPKEWAYNGPQLLSRVMARRCHTNVFTRNVTPEKCGGFRCLPIKDFYPVHWSKWDKYFTEKDAETTMKLINGSLGVHVWNSRSSHVYNIPLSSKQPYVQVVRRVCPSVITTIGDTI